MEKYNELEYVFNSRVIHDKYIPNRITLVTDLKPQTSITVLCKNQ